MPRDSHLPGPADRHPASLRTDLRLIADMVEGRSRVLDIGCGDGDLLDSLVRLKGVDGRGVELSQQGVQVCVSRGLPVIQGDADTDLDNYPAGAFDYAILSQTLQATRNPRGVLANLVRIGRHAIVSFPNFGCWRVRLSLLWSGRMPVTHGLPDQWYETPNIHSCTVTDFVELCREMGIAIERSLILRAGGRAVPMRPGARANWLGEQAVFLLRRDDRG